MVRKAQGTIRPTAVAVGDHIIYEERQGDMWLSRRGIVARLVHNRQGQTIASTENNRVLFVYELTNKFPGKIWLLERQAPQLSDILQGPYTEEDFNDEL